MQEPFGAVTSCDRAPDGLGLDEVVCLEAVLSAGKNGSVL